MDNSITEHPQTEAEKLLAFYSSTKAVQIPMTATPESKQIHSHGYSLDHKTIRVQFKWGNSIYDYHHCQPEKAAAFASCESKGSFMAKELKGVHHFECVRERDPK
jgi:hypothetical protein